MSQFRKAVRRKVKLRLSLAGPPGAGKTYTALRIAMGLKADARIVVIDTEGRSGELYAGYQMPEGLADYDVLELTEYTPEAFTAGIRDAGKAGYDVIIIDSLSHAWDAVLAAKDDATNRSKSKNSYNAWAVATPLHNEIISSILQSPAHVIATLRTKVEFVQNESRGYDRVGLKAIQRDGVEYEFTVCADMATDGEQMVITKTRCPALSRKIFKHPGGDVAAILRKWLDNGESGSDALDAALTAAGISRADFDGWAVAKGKGKDFASEAKLWAAADWITNKGGAARIRGDIAKAAVQAEEPEQEAEPEPEQKAKSKHHPSWADGGQALFFASAAVPLKRFEYEELCAYLAAMTPPRPRPSEMDADARRKLVTWLLKEDNADLVVEHAAKEVAA